MITALRCMRKWPGYVKEMLVFNEPYHLIFNECPERIIGPVVQKLKEYE